MIAEFSYPGFSEDLILACLLMVAMEYSPMDINEWRVNEEFYFSNRYGVAVGRRGHIYYYGVQVVLLIQEKNSDLRERMSCFGRCYRNGWKSTFPLTG